MRIGSQVDAPAAAAVYGDGVRLRSLLGRHGVEALVIVLTLAAVVEAWVDSDPDLRRLTVPFAFTWTLPLLLRHRFPLAAPLTVFVALALEALVTVDAVTESQTNTLAILAAFGIAGAHPDVRAGIAGAAVGCGVLVLIMSLQTVPAESVVFMLVFAAAAWGIGRAVGERGRRAESLEERAERLERAHAEAVAGERATIARELHDVIAHSVSVMVVQTSAARRLLDRDPARAASALSQVEETGRQSLTEMRRLLGLPHEGEDRADLSPQPTLDRLDDLIRQFSEAGLPVAARIEGEPRPLASGVDVSAYRIIQEGLTNALKHAEEASRVTVTLRYRARELEINVADDGRPVTTPRGNGERGHGLVGMRERVTLLGGHLDVGPDAEGGFSVHAALPLEAAQ
jgi:signal transduction histidine kinase